MKKVVKKSKGLYTRGNNYYVRKTIPVRLREIAGKREFVVSLKTNNYELAIQKYEQTIKSIDRIMQSLNDGTYIQDDYSFDYCMKIAASNGRKLECISTIINDPIKVAAVVNGLKKAEANDKLSKQTVQSFVKFNDKSVKLSQLVDIYLEAKKLELKEYNIREYGRKVAPFKNCCKQLITFLGKDKLVSELNKSDARAFYNELKDRVYKRKIAANSANKYLTHIRVLIDTYHHEHDINHENIFKGLRFTDKKNQRTPLKIDFIRDNWINNPAFEKISPELKYLVWAMIDTGCGFKELCGLDPKADIHMDAEIPYIHIRPNEARRIKNDCRIRVIPLVNLSLEAFKQFPNGFAHYNTPNGPTNASATLNKFMKNNNLFACKGQSLNSIRHCFKDRLRFYNIPAEMQDNFMGHKSEGMGSHYGDGYTIQQKHEALLKMVGDLKITNLN